MKCEPRIVRYHDDTYQAWCNLHPDPWEGPIRTQWAMAKHDKEDHEGTVTEPPPPWVRGPGRNTP